MSSTDKGLDFTINQQIEKAVPFKIEFLNRIWNYFSMQMSNF